MLISYKEILASVDAVDPLAYAKSRNFVHGAVTRLSPYISRGVITLPQLLQTVLAKQLPAGETVKLLQEFAWREYFQRVWCQYGDAIFSDLKEQQQDVVHHSIPRAIVAATTGIEVVDEQIKNLYDTGYVHNHARMYIASIACNIAKAHWKMPSQWMYYHLLDGDLASNACSWQWVAGSFSKKKYVANQENINYYLNSQQRNSFLDLPYDQLPPSEIPEILKQQSDFEMPVDLPETDAGFHLDSQLPLLVYTTYWLNPEWRQAVDANRVFLLEPAHFAKFPVSKKVIDFCLALARTNIPGIQVFVGSFEELHSQYGGANIISLEHPLHLHFSGLKDPYPWMFPQINAFSQSFFSFWKKCEKLLPVI